MADWQSHRSTQQCSVVLILSVEGGEQMYSLDRDGGWIETTWEFRVVILIVMSRLELADDESTGTKSE